MTAPKFTLQSSQPLSLRGRIKSVVILGNSPDLIPIENMFGCMKQFMDNRPMRKSKELRKEVVKVWKELPDDYLKSVCTSMLSRICALVKNKGYSTKY